MIAWAFSLHPDFGGHRKFSAWEEVSLWDNASRDIEHRRFWDKMNNCNGIPKRMDKICVGENTCSIRINCRCLSTRI